MKIDTIYIENAAKSHPNTHDIIKRIKYKNIIYCDSYSEVFNANNQNFRIQKESPSLILAYKKKKTLYLKHLKSLLLDLKIIIIFLIFLIVLMIVNTVFFRECLTQQIMFYL